MRGRGKGFQWENIDSPILKNEIISIVVTNFMYLKLWYSLSVYAMLLMPLLLIIMNFFFV